MTGSSRHGIVPHRRMSWEQRVTPADAGQCPYRPGTVPQNLGDDQTRRGDETGPRLMQKDE